MSRSGKLSHEQLERFVTDVLSKREPCPAMVLAWGWALKQGQGGILHNDTFKQRYFVLARVPHATVLIYYGQKCMDEDHILGYIDLRRVTSVRETSRVVALDTNKSPASAMMNRLKGLMGAAPPVEGTPRPVIELQTASRTFVLAAASIVMPQPMTTSMAISGESMHKPLYLFGWPFPVPPMDDDSDEQRIADQVATGQIDSEAFAQWRDVMATAVAAEKATRVFPVMTLVDSSAQLPQRVLLRTTPCELAVISVEDKDLCFTAIPYNDLLKWEVPLDTELHVTARTRSRLVARPDRMGFTAQRPTRRTCHYVFKSSAARAIVGVIDNHLRALAKQLGAAEGGALDGGAGGGAGGEDAYGAAADEFESSGGAGAGGADEDGEDEGSGKAAKKLTAKKGGYAEEASPAFKAGSSARRAAAGSDDDGSGSDSDAAAARRRPAAKKGAAGGSGRKAAAADSDDSDSDSDAKAKAKAAAAKKKKAAASDSDGSDSDDGGKAKAKAKAKAAAKKKAAASDSDDSDDGGKAKAKAKAKKKAAASDSDSE